MSKKRFTPEEINGKLRHADVLLGQDKKVTEIAKVLGITDITSSAGVRSSAECPPPG
jgi:hypothetical protein